jgi:hypothetical protein
MTVAAVTARDGRADAGGRLRRSAGPRADTAAGLRRAAACGDEHCAGRARCTVSGRRHTRRPGRGGCAAAAARRAAAAAAGGAHQQQQRAARAPRMRGVRGCTARARWPAAAAATLPEASQTPQRPAGGAARTLGAGRAIPRAVPRAAAARWRCIPASVFMAASRVQCGGRVPGRSGEDRRGPGVGLGRVEGRRVGVVDGRPTRNAGEPTGTAPWAGSAAAAAAGGALGGDSTARRTRGAWRPLAAGPRPRSGGPRHMLGLPACNIP